MADRRLVVAEVDSGDAHYGEMFVVSPNRATGVNIPAFKTGAVRPTVGSTVGEAFYESNTSKGWVWDGATWKEIAASPIQSFRTEADLRADTATAVGRMATAADTGGLFIKQATGWQYVGIKDYATATNLLADNPTAGSMGVALDENTLWQMSATGWRCLVPREFPDTASVQDWVVPLGTPAGQNPTGVHVGDQAVAVDVGVLYVRLATGWLPTTLYEDTEANIRAAGWSLNGQEAIATDTGRTFTYNETVGWIEEPIQHYATDALLLASTPPNGTMAWADDTATVYIRAAGAWKNLSGSQTGMGTTAPTTPSAGDFWFDTTNKVLKVYTGTKWLFCNGGAPSEQDSWLLLPGYFSEDPSATSVADDVGGLGFRYYGSTSRLYLKKGAIHPATPLLGDATNAGKMVVGDSGGNPTWGAKPLATAYSNVSGANECIVSYVTATQMLRVWGSFTNETDHCYPKIILQVNGGWLNWNGPMVTKGDSMISYTADGKTFSDLKDVSDNSGGWLIGDSDANYRVGQNNPCFYQFDVCGFGNQGTDDHVQIHFSIGWYKSANGTPMMGRGCYRMASTVDPTLISDIGIKWGASGYGTCFAEWI